MLSSSETYSRRRFLGALVAGAASGVARKEWKDFEEEKENPVFNKTTVEVLHESYSEKIDFTSGLHQEYPPELLLQLSEFLTLQGQRLGGYKTSGAEGEVRGMGSRAVVRMALDGIEKGRELQKKTWKVIAKIIGDSHEYEEAYYMHALAYDLPRALAKYGIFAKGILFAQGDPETDKLSIEDVVFRFYEIDRCVRTDLVRWGKEIARDVVYINGVVPGIDQTQFDSQFPNPEAQAIFKNVFVFREEYLTAGKEFSEKRHRGDLEAYESITLEDLVSFLHKKGDNKTTRMQILEILMYKELLRENLQDWQWTDRILEHETGHLIEQSDPRFAAYFTPASTNKLSEYQLKCFEKRTKDEMAALISELRYTENKLPSLKFSLSWCLDTLDAGYAYVKATQWIFDKIFDIICAHPDTYGMKTSSQAGLSLESQVLFQFIDFSRTSKFLDVMDLVKKDFEAMYDKESFEKEIGDVFKIYPPASSGTRDFLCTAAVAGGIAYGLLGFLQRKEDVKKAEKNPVKS